MDDRKASENSGGKRPSMQWYTGDWLKDPAVRSVSFAARGLWTDMLSLMFECDRKGFLTLGEKPVTAEQLARMTGGSTDEVTRLLSELESSGVFSRTDHGMIYSRRMVRDERKLEQTRLRVAKHRRKNDGNAGVTPVKLSCTEDEDEDEENEGGRGGKNSTELPAPIPRSNLPCDNVELCVVAKRLAILYQEIVGAAHPRGNGIELIIGVLNSGQTEEALAASIRAYAEFCEQKEKSKKHRLALGTFFAESGSWEEFLSANQDKPPPTVDPLSPEAIKKYQEEQAEKRAKIGLKENP